MNLNKHHRLIRLLAISLFIVPANGCEFLDFITGNTSSAGSAAANVQASNPDSFTSAGVQDNQPQAPGNTSLFNSPPGPSRSTPQGSNTLPSSSFTNTVFSGLDGLHQNTVPTSNRSNTRRLNSPHTSVQQVPSSNDLTIRPPTFTPIDKDRPTLRFSGIDGIESDASSLRQNLPLSQPTDTTPIKPVGGSGVDVSPRPRNNSPIKFRSIDQLDRFANNDTPFKPPASLNNDSIDLGGGDTRLAMNDGSSLLS